jgi:hypothetical protein
LIHWGREEELQSRKVKLALKENKNSHLTAFISRPLSSIIKRMSFAMFKQSTLSLTIWHVPEHRCAITKHRISFFSTHSILTSHLLNDVDELDKTP